MPASSSTTPSEAPVSQAANADDGERDDTEDERDRGGRGHARGPQPHDPLTGRERQGLRRRGGARHPLLGGLEEPRDHPDDDGRARTTR